MKHPHWPVALGYKPIDLGLERVREHLDRLGNPHEKLPPVVHFAGTNGKGSTIAFLRTILEKSGYKVHVYTSPHLVNFNERIILAGEEISDGYLYEILEECRVAADGIKLTYFEGTTSAALLAFSRIKADIVLLETGMGGRLDATNVIDKPALTVITPISLDHTAYLGDSITKIAAEKAAIIKQDVPCVASRQPQEALQVIKQYAAEKSANTFTYGEDWEVTLAQNGFNYKSELLNLDLPTPSLLGAHQVTNAGAAIAAAQLLQETAGFNLPQTTIKQAVTDTKWAGRLQRITSGKIIDLLHKHNIPSENQPEIWVDGGHNIAAAEMLAGQCQKWRKENKEIYLVAAMMNNRNPSEFLSPFRNIAGHCFAVPIQDEQNCHTPQEIVNAGQKIGLASSAEKNIYDAVETTLSMHPVSGKEPPVILICGSLYLAGNIIVDNN